jgi:glycosyltransferase-like protein
MLAHSTNPRGGVVHAMQLSEALEDLGQTVVLHAPDAAGKGFFREARCQTRAFRVAPAMADMTDMVEQRIADYVRHFEPPEARDFDVFHAHDGISGNALVTLKERGLIPHFVRTVHHIDQFPDSRLMTLQARSITAADGYFAVSRTWQLRLEVDWGIAAALSGNGVDVRGFEPNVSRSDTALRTRLGLGPGPVFLSIGGIERRKNPVRILDAFLKLLTRFTDAQLVIAGGATLLDHGAYQREFAARLASMDAATTSSVHLPGVIADADMAPLYRLAHALVFASVEEGFGLCVLEAMACGTPVVVSSIAPFTEYLAEDDALWCDPSDPSSIADAMTHSFDEMRRRRLIDGGIELARRFGWDRVALAHLPTYARLGDLVHA